MRIGIDFDNTIACYDGVFHAAALERGLIPAELGRTTRIASATISMAFRPQGRFHRTAGLCLRRAHGPGVASYPGFAELVECGAATPAIALFIVSHKTKHPILGPKHDMHARGARLPRLHEAWWEPTTAMPAENVFFELTKEEKVARAARSGCRCFRGRPSGNPWRCRVGWHGCARSCSIRRASSPTESGTIRRFERHGSWQEISRAVVKAGADR